MSGLRYLDVCAGISASTVAWKPLGWIAAAYSEIEAAPRAVLAHHYPDTPLHGDFTTIRGDEYGAIDLLVGGTPCQDFSVAGLRAGLDGDRGNLSLEFLRLADRTRPRWVVWENVPGVLSIDGGRAFGAILGGLGELGYGFAYRVLDAQFFGVPQRRRRVFVVGCAGNWRGAAAVLSERHSLSGHPAPRRKAGQDVAGVLTSRASGGGGGPGAGTDEAAAGYLQPVLAHALRGEGFDASEDGTGRGTPLVPVHAIQAGALRENINSGPDGIGVQRDCAYTLEARAEVQAVCFSAKDYGADAGEIAPTLRAGGHSGSHANAGIMPAIAFAQNQRDEVRTMHVAGALAAEPGMKQQTYIATSAVRRLTPRECERLQGFPDDYTLVPHRGKPMADGPRYKALGNSMAVPVMRWIGERIDKVEQLSAESLAA
ncbi:DNA cytosine methyltransferase [Sphingomonas sp.]|uniref:DNA cytosine methyltransferase n=1 Tax=Sphingomonas sp. TaxID=28214 RepID=UPI0035C82625